MKTEMMMQNVYLLCTLEPYAPLYKHVYNCILYIIQEYLTYKVYTVNLDNYSRIKLLLLIKIAWIAQKDYRSKALLSNRYYYLISSLMGKVLCCYRHLIGGLRLELPGF